MANHSRLSGLVSHLFAIWLNACRSIHKPKTLRQKGYYLLIKCIHSGAHLGHCFALFWRLHHYQPIIGAFAQVTDFSAQLKCIRPEQYNVTTKVSQRLAAA